MTFIIFKFFEDKFIEISHLYIFSTISLFNISIIKISSLPDGPTFCPESHSQAY